MNRLLTRLIYRDSLRLRRLGVIAWLVLFVCPLLHAQTTAPANNATDPAVETTAPAAEPTPNAAQEVAPLMSREENYNQLLAAASPDDVRWLDTPEEKVLALFRPTEARTTKGAVLILHAAEIPPGWPPSFDNLRRYLPRYGWVTLAVALPAQVTQRIPQREIPPPTPEEEQTDQDAATEQAPEPAAKAEAETSPEPEPSRAEVIARRVGAAAAFLREQGQQNIVVLVDNSSVVDSMTGLQTAAGDALQALVLVNLQIQEPLTKPQLEQLFSNPGLPVLDLFTQPDSDQQASLRQNHRAAALRNKIEHYYQLRLLPLHPQDSDNPRSFWLERTRGFMERHALGKETSKDKE